MKSQSGNVLFYIFIAIALLAALSYAVTQSMRGGNGASGAADHARLYATEIIENANTFASAVGQMRLRGVAVESLCFDDTGWGNTAYNHAGCATAKNKLFAPEGGGLSWSRPPSEAMDSSAAPDNLWHFYGNNEIQNAGTTPGTAAGADLIVTVDSLSLSVCRQINDLLGVTSSAAASPPTDSAIGTVKYIGVFARAATIGDEDAALSYRNSACIQNTGTSHYMFYKVLVAR
jgi:hypothetical protein